ncbi:hypothetical protein GOBAR_DD33574 [Gossypium barbadense]|nr:hypothetical protein GOBAR_DD33574 [Gossypium barbadense]
MDALLWILVVEMVVWLFYGMRGGYGVGAHLGDWQHRQFKRLKSRMRRLVDRIDRLIDGPILEYNTNELKATRRNKRNRIEGLFNPDGVWVKGPSDVCGLAKDYFLSLFIYETCGNFEGILDQISRCISPEMNLLLDGPVTDREIFEAFNQMDPRKAPGIDRGIIDDMISKVKNYW